MDESNGNCHQRFDQLGITTTVDNCRAYRELILTTSNLSKYISGAILYEETKQQSLSSAPLLPCCLNKQKDDFL